MKTLIKNGLVYDGSGNRAEYKDILIAGERIIGIFDPPESEQISGINEVMDASGCVVTPGFIDIHRHCDIKALTDDDFGTLELAQGLTTVFGGNCGLAPLPQSTRYKREMADFIEPCLGRDEIGVVPGNYASYFSALENKKIPLNMGTFIGFGAVCASVKGYGKSPLTQAQISEAKALIKEGLSEGAAGLSIGLMYQPECYLSSEEIKQLLCAASPFQRTMTCHIRGEGDSLVPSVKEVIELGRTAGLPVNISHFKATGINNWGSAIHQAIECILEARNRGEDVTADFYPYCGGSTTAISLVPPVMQTGTLEEMIDYLDSQEGREKFRKEIYQKHDGWDNMVLSIGWERIIISSVMLADNQKYSGKNIKDASIMVGYDEPADFLCMLLAQESGKVGVIVMSMSQEDVDTVARLPFTMAISDGLYGAGDNPHPRLYGAFPRIIRDFVLERGVLTMEEAVKKMTYLPAKRLGLLKRGQIAVGNYGDLNLFVPEKFKDKATFEKSKQLAKGLTAVYLSGKKVLEQDRIIRSDCGNMIQMI